MRRATRGAILGALALSAAGCFRVGLEWVHGAVTDDGGDGADGDADADGDGDADADRTDEPGADAIADVDGPPDAGPDAALDADEWEAGPCDESPCRLVAPQCGCAPWLACQRPRGDDPYRECMPPGPAGLLEACAVNGDCATAYVCLSATSAPGACVPYCETSAGCPGESYCAEMVLASEPVGACTHSCDPMTGGLCPAGAACLWSQVRRLDDGAIVPATLCGPDEGLPGVGAACTALCRQGAVCVGGTCEELCVVAAPSCSTGACVALSGGVIRGVAHGTCR